MKVPDIRLFRPENFEEVVDFLGHEGFEPPKHADEFGGLGLIARDENDGSIIGFVWALWAPPLRIAYADYFAVKGTLRKSSVAYFLGLALARYLQEMDVVRILWVTPSWNWAFIRAMRERGARDMGDRRLLVSELVRVDTGDREDADGRVLQPDES